MEMISKAIVDGSLEALSKDKKEPVFIHASGDPDAIPADGRRFAIKEEYGQRAQHVDPYKPNRKQLRAQKAAKRKQKAKSRSK